MSGWWASVRGALWGSRSRAVVTLAVASGVVVGSTAVVALPGRSAATEIWLEAADSPGVDPFVVVPTTVPPVAPLEEVMESSPVNSTGSSTASSGESSVEDPEVRSGGEPGLYGGTRNEVECDVEQMVAFFAREPAKAAAWAGVQGIADADLGEYLRGLTPVVLRADVRVTNHGFVDGRARPRQSILERGTAVLVDAEGVPRAKCSCGNPLLPPEPVRGAARLVGDPWPGFDPGEVIRIEPGEVEGGFVLVDGTGEEFFRPFGSDGSEDRAVERVASEPPVPSTTSTSLPSRIVPDVAGLSDVEAVAILEDAGFEVTERSVTSERPIGEVLGTDPPAGRASTTGRVIVRVSTGPVTVTVPDVGGLDEATATVTLTGVGLSITGTVTEPADDVAAGSVIRTDPPAGTALPPGASVTLVLSSGPAEEQTRVPRVIGSTEARARRALQDARLKVVVTTRIDDDVVSGTVVDVTPRAGTVVPVGSTVTIVVARGTPTVGVPAVTDMPVAAASAALDGAGFVVSIEPRPGPDNLIDIVIEQRPAAGSPLRPGATVTLVVGTPDLVTVPDLHGLTQPEAQARLDAAGLTRGTITSQVDPAPAGTIIHQTPNPGIITRRGAPVNLTLSAGPPAPTPAPSPAPTPQPTPEPSPPPLPQVAGLSEAEARKQLTAYVITGVEQESNERVPAGIVIRTDPPGGQPLPVGSGVTLVLSSGPQLVEVPSVFGLPIDDARRAIERAGLIANPVAISGCNFTEEQWNRVVDQGGRPGERVPRGTTVTYWYPTPCFLR